MQLAQQLRQRHALDFVVGSVHHVRDVPFDFSAEVYKSALDLFDGSYSRLAECYYDDQVRNVTEGISQSRLCITISRPL